MSNKFIGTYRYRSLVLHGSLVRQLTFGRAIILATMAIVLMPKVRGTSERSQMFMLFLVTAQCPAPHEVLR